MPWYGTVWNYEPGGNVEHIVCDSASKKLELCLHIKDFFRKGCAFPNVGDRPTASVSDILELARRPSPTLAAAPGIAPLVGDEFNEPG